MPNINTDAISYDSDASKIVFWDLSTIGSVGRVGYRQEMLWRKLRLGTLEEAFVEAEI